MARLSPFLGFLKSFQVQDHFSIKPNTPISLNVLAVVTINKFELVHQLEYLELCVIF